MANLKAYYVLPKPEEPLPENFTELNKAIEELSSTDPALLAASPANPLNNEEVKDAVFNLEPGADEPKPIEQKSLLNRIGQAIFDQEQNLELMTIAIRGLTQPVEDREQVISQEHMNYIVEVIQYFENVMGLEVLELEYLMTPREIHLKTKNGLVIWVSMDRDYKEQIDKLKTIYEPAELNKEDLAYIDLRIREKVIYCPRQSRCNKK